MIDPHGLLVSVRDGCTVEVDGVVVGFCGGEGPSALDRNYTGHVDVLVSHEGGFGDAAGPDLSRGPESLIRYLEVSRPRFHVFGHFHHTAGPVRVHQTQCVQLASVVRDPRHSGLQVVNEGCIGAMDTKSGDFEFVRGEWLSSYSREGGLRLRHTAYDYAKAAERIQATAYPEAWNFAERHVLRLGMG